MPEVEGNNSKTPKSPENVSPKPWLRLEGVLKSKANTKPNDPRIISLHLSIPGATRFEEGRHKDLLFRQNDPEYDSLKRTTSRKPKSVEVRVYQGQKTLSVEIKGNPKDQGVIFNTTSERPLGNAFEYFKRISQNKPRPAKDPLEAGDIPPKEVRPFTGNPHFIQGGAPGRNRRRH